jgi:hypothetical protein
MTIRARRDAFAFRLSLARLDSPVVHTATVIAVGGGVYAGTIAA